MSIFPSRRAITRIQAAIILVVLIVVVVGAVYLMKPAPSAAQTVVMYHTTGEDPIFQAVSKDLKAKFNIELVNVNPAGGGGAVAEKVILEMNNPQADIIDTSVPSIFAARDKGALEQLAPGGNWNNSIVPNAKQIPANLRDSKGYTVGLYSYPYCWIYNTAKVKPEDLPKSMDDFLNPKWKGAIGYPDPRSSGSGIAYVWETVYNFNKNVTRAMQYLKRLEANVKVHPPPNTELINRGEILLQRLNSVDSTVDYYVNNRTNQMPFYIPGLPNAFGYVAVGLVKNAPHRAAALTVLNYLLSPEGNANTGASWGLPTNPAAFQLLDSSLKAKLQPLTTVAYVVPDWDYIASNMSTWREMWASTVLGS